MSSGSAKHANNDVDDQVVLRLHQHDVVAQSRVAVTIGRRRQLHDHGLWHGIDRDTARYRLANGPLFRLAGRQAAVVLLREARRAVPSVAVTLVIVGTGCFAMVVVEIGPDLHVFALLLASALFRLFRLLLGALIGLFRLLLGFVAMLVAMALAFACDRRAHREQGCD